MLISRKLWRALTKPPRRHPLFQYVLADAHRGQTRITSGFFVWGLMLFAALFLAIVLVQWMTTLIITLVIALNSIYAARWVVRIATTILHEKETGRYDLLAALPIGLLGTSWAISTGCVHRRSSFQWMPYLMLIIAIIAFVTICGLITVTFTLLSELSRNEAAMMQNVYFANIGILAIPLVILFYVDHIYSILTAVLFGQIATIDLQRSSDGQVKALLGFLAIQITTYALTLGVGILVLPIISRSLGFGDSATLVIIGILAVLCFIVIREFTVRYLWKYLITLLEADNKEIALVLKPFYEAEAILRDSEQARVRHMDAT